MTKLQSKFYNGNNTLSARISQMSLVASSGLHWNIL